MTQEKFTVVGTTMYQGATKVRFANDIATRVKTLVKNGHDNIELFELPKAMTKPDALAYLATQKLSKAAAEAVANKSAEYTPSAPKAKAAKAVTPAKKATPSIAAKAKAAKAAAATPNVTPTEIAPVAEVTGAIVTPVTNTTIASTEDVSAA